MGLLTIRVFLLIQIENTNRTDAKSLVVESVTDTDISDESQSEGKKRVKPKENPKAKPAKKRKNCGCATKTYIIEAVLDRRVQNKQVTMKRL